MFLVLQIQPTRPHANHESCLGCKPMIGWHSNMFGSWMKVPRRQRWHCHHCRLGDIWHFLRCWNLLYRILIFSSSSLPLYFGACAVLIEDEDMDKGKHWESLIDFLWKSQSARYLPGPAPKIPLHRRRQWIKNLPSAPGVCCFRFIGGNWAPKVVFVILVIHYIRNFPSSCQRNLLKKISCASVVDSLPNSQQLGVMKRRWILVNDVYFERRLAPILGEWFHSPHKKRTKHRW